MKARLKLPGHQTWPEPVPAAGQLGAAKGRSGGWNPRDALQRQQLQAAFGPSWQPGGVVQRAVVTAGGTWDTEEYSAWGPSRPDPFSEYGLGAEISLSFMPGAGSPIGRKIGLIQSVKAQANEKSDPTGDEAVEPNEQGLTIDRSKGLGGERTTSPVYGANNTAADKATTLADRLPSGGGNQWGRRHRWLRNKVARLWDKPSSAVVKGEILKVFETAAVVLEGPETGQYLGTVSWGYKRDKNQNGPPRLEPAALTKVSDGNPSAEFRTAAEHWNQKVHNQDGHPMVKVPLPPLDAPE